MSRQTNHPHYHRQRLKHNGLASRYFLLIIAAALAGYLGLRTAYHYFSQSPESPSSVELKTVRLINPARELPDYRLTLSDGSPLTATTLRGHWTVIFLGFTHCPDVCPTTLAILAKAQNIWATIPENQRPKVLFVSVDPERDTPDIIGDYAHFFHPATLAATADSVHLAQFAQALGLVFAKVPLANGDYTMDHSATLVLLDPQGRQAGLIRAPLVAADIGEDVKRLAEITP